MAYFPVMFPLAVDRCQPVLKILFATPDTTNTSWYTNVTYTCNVGYEWLDNKTSHVIMCKNDGLWNSSQEQADDIPCHSKFASIYCTRRIVSADITLCQNTTTCFPLFHDICLYG